MPAGVLLQPARRVAQRVHGHRDEVHVASDRIAVTVEGKGADVILFGTGNRAHVKANIESILRPPLPAPVIERLHRTFGHLSGVGLDLPGPVKGVTMAVVGTSKERDGLMKVDESFDDQKDTKGPDGYSENDLEKLDPDRRALVLMKRAQRRG